MNEMNLHYEYMKDSPLVFLRPTGTPTAPIVSGELSGQHVSVPIEIAIPFSLADTNTTLEFWAKPDATGPVAQFAGHEIVYTGGSYRVSNGSEEYAEVPAPSNAVRHLSITVMNTSIILSVDGEFDEVGKEFYTPTPDEKAIIFPYSGGLIDFIALYSHQVDKRRLIHHFEKGRELPDFAYDSLSKMSDDERMNVTVENFLPEPLVVPGESLTELTIPHDPNATSFKFEWEQTGNVFISFDNEWRPSGYSTNVFPEEITVDIFEGTLHNFVLTTYGDNSVNSGDQEAYLTTPYSTATGETHPLFHSDSGGAIGGVEITPKGPLDDGIEEPTTEDSSIGTISFWTNKKNGEITPGVTVIDGVVSGAQFLNGAPATSDPMHGWYMVTLTGVWDESVVLNGPISNITLDKTQLSAAEVNRLYRSFFGFDSVIIESNTLSVTDSTPFSITKSWAIVSSG